MFRMTLLIAILFLSSSLFAQDYPALGPLPMRTQQPIYLQMPALVPEVATVLPQGMIELRADSSYSNLYERAIFGATDIHLDMELWQIDGVLKYGVGDGWELGLNLPMRKMNGGFLDAALQNYHNTFGFPNAGRNLVPNGAYSYSVIYKGESIYNISPQDFIVGDLSIFTKHQIVDEAKRIPAVAWRFLFKFPSGDPDEGGGSGEPGFCFGINLEKSHRRWHGYLNLNFLFDGGNYHFENFMNQQVFDFALAGEYNFSRKVSGIVQLMGETPRLKNIGLETWDGIPLDLIFGVRGEHDVYFWQIGFSEDVRSTGPSVDFTTFFSFGVRFHHNRSRVYQGDFWATR